jgi:hypothetical protein
VNWADDATQEGDLWAVHGAHGSWETFSSGNNSEYLNTKHRCEVELQLKIPQVSPLELLSSGPSDDGNADMLTE